MHEQLLFTTLFTVLILIGGAATAQTDNRQPLSLSLIAKYEQTRSELAQSTFGQPILLNSNVSDQQAQGEVLALLDTSFRTLADTLSQPANWCDLAILHINIKSCTFTAQQVRFFVGSKEYQAPSKAFPLLYRYQTIANSADYLHIRLDAAEGPFGTGDYLISLEAVPVDTERSFIRFHYRYQFGLLARLAMNTYLATKGRSKVGFTVTGIDDEGRAVYVKGLQGVVERNVMRYLIAIQSVLEGSDMKAENRHQHQLEHWYDYSLKYPLQLLELERDDYLANKQRELENQVSLQQDTIAEKSLY